MEALNEMLEKYESLVERYKEIKDSIDVTPREKTETIEEQRKVRRELNDMIDALVKEKYLKGVWKVVRKEYFYGDSAIVKNEKHPELVKLLKRLYTFENKTVFMNFVRKHKAGDIDSDDTMFRINIYETGDLEIAGIYDYDDILFLRDMGLEFDVSVLTRVKQHHQKKLDKVQHELDVWTLEKVDKITKR